MYEPVRDGIDKSANHVYYSEINPPNSLSGLVDNFWQLKTTKTLKDDFQLHALPDACINVLFNLIDTRIAGVTALQTTYTTLNLGKEFHYLGIQFLPGVWQGDLNETTGSYVNAPYAGSLPLAEIGYKLKTTDEQDRGAVLSEFVEYLVGKRLVEENKITSTILSSIESIQTVADMARTTHKSPRQLQRLLKKRTGFSPHDFLKVIRLQQSFKQDYLESYTDQSHFIHSFKKITGYTPTEYYRKYNV